MSLTHEEEEISDSPISCEESRVETGLAAVRPLNVQREAASLLLLLLTLMVNSIRADNELCSSESS